MLITNNHPYTYLYLSEKMLIANNHPYVYYLNNKIIHKMKKKYLK